MKTKILIPVLMFVCMLTYAGSIDESGYVVSNNDTILCSKVLFDFNNVQITLKNGETVKLEKDKINAFKANGKSYEKKEIFKDKKPTGEFAYMELLGQRDGLKLYCYKYFEGPVAGYTVKSLFVYKDNNFYLQVSDNNSKTVLDYFHVEGSQL
jgi:hypothetical protein